MIAGDLDNRTAAFAAMRRAVAHARALDALSNKAWPGTAQRFTDRYAATQIRNAIRLATKEDKT